MRQVICVAIGCALAFAPSIARAQWDPEVPMTSTGGDIFGNGIAASGSNVHLIYAVGGVTYPNSTFMLIACADAVSSR